MAIDNTKVYSVQSFWQRKTHLHSNGKMLCGTTLSSFTIDSEMVMVGMEVREVKKCLDKESIVLFPEYEYCQRCLKLFKSKKNPNPKS